ncbi:hypothetical protein ACFW2V_14080 [Streptomyces sp. NPDC058947]|uniref:hypothetical protein n=1 Tax=Streptomyces sp. NPDC058947 TaxID=3346675 RepID=UPI0036ACF563
MSGGVERTGELVDFHLIRTSQRDEYEILPSTIRKPDCGTYCRHGLKIIEAVPVEHTLQEPRPLCTLGRDDPFHVCAEPRYCLACHPATRKVQPWPCREEGCTEADFDREQQAGIEEYWAGVNDLMRIQYE